MDALFGLPRKKAAGQSVREPIHGHLLFGDQASADEFVSVSAPAKQSKVPTVSFIRFVPYYTFISDAVFNLLFTVVQ